MSKTTAVAKLTGKAASISGTVGLSFYADYNDERNKAWAKYTPALSISITVLESVAEQFEQGANYLVTFEAVDDGELSEEPASVVYSVEDVVKELQTNPRHASYAKNDHTEQWDSGYKEALRDVLEALNVAVTPDWSDPEQVRAEYERTGINRTNEPPAGKPIEELTSAEAHAAHFAAKREAALVREGRRP
ncbi:hypothetical protein [Arthrobacter sp. B1805]|uniref:hypothetical protein n=1 Tax=Arthrobacter sp. B1805 TaxID=2058892 RepID=UPI000CE413C5|nr:hypothetical protein [Arthrobacter sp. B1805]